MSHVLVSVVAEVAANCYFSEHFQFSTSPDIGSFTVNFTQVQAHSSLVELLHDFRRIPIQLGDPGVPYKVHVKIPLRQEILLVSL